MSRDQTVSDRKMNHQPMRGLVNQGHRSCFWVGMLWVMSVVISWAEHVPSFEPLPTWREPPHVIYPERDTRASPFDEWKQQARRQRPINTPLSWALFRIRYAKAADLAAILGQQSKMDISVDPRTNSLWVQSTPEKVTFIKTLIQQLDIPLQQVMIEARIVNMTRGCAEDLGIRFGLSQTPWSGSMSAANALSQGVAPGDIPIKDRLNVDLGAVPLLANPVSMGIALARLGHHALLDLELSALESEGRAEIIASPRLMTVNQQPALIKAGEDIPYQESALSGATTVAFKQAVMSLKVTPQITPDGQLLMALVINQDSDSGQRVQGVPIVLTKSIETNVLIKNGQTIVLGGIYKQDKNNSIARVPFLGDIPWIGKVFQRKEQRIKNEELLIFITPRIIGSVGNRLHGQK